LNDGTTLSDVSETAPPPFFQTPDSAPTQFMSLPPTSAAKSSSDSSKWLYLIIGVMATALIALGITVFLSRNSTEKETAKTEPGVKSNENVSTTNQSNAENKTSEPPNNKSNTTAFAPPRLMPSINPNLNPAGRWSGDWTSNKAYWTATMVLNDNGGGRFAGEIYWTLQRHTNPKKSGKSGATATEYVQGTFNPATRTLSLSGYRKDDPQNVAVLDRYSLILAENNQSLGGGSKTNGRFNLSR
ncbi:MAG: hypothetical protein LH614_14900, partial [Pyrinomonadaceae bacterium]|nr:hypothetical protein [Pyrinomonadaceae bacterium]